MEEKILASFETILAYANQAAEFAAEQAPLVVQELIMWGIASSAFSAAMAAVLSIVFYLTAKKCYRLISAENEKQYSDRNEAVQVVSVITGVISGIGIPITALITITSLYDMVYVIVAPRLYVLEYASKIINGG
jgi:hypothetical protein